MSFVLLPIFLLDKVRRGKRLNVTIHFWCSKSRKFIKQKRIFFTRSQWNQFSWESIQFWSYSSFIVSHKPIEHFLHSFCQKKISSQSDRFEYFLNVIGRMSTWRVVDRFSFFLSSFSTGVAAYLFAFLCLSLPEGQIGEQYHIIVDDIDVVYGVVFLFFSLLFRRPIWLIFSFLHVCIDRHFDTSNCRWVKGEEEKNRAQQRTTRFSLDDVDDKH